VNDTNFSERFAAIPDDGWYFQKWNSGDRFFCGDSTDLICTLSFQGHEDSKAVEDMVASTEVFYIMPVFKQFPDMIAVDGKQWYQPYLFTELSWAEINAVCPAGECAGVLNGYDMTGWTWASIKDVNALFNYYIGSEVLGPGPDEFFEIYTSAWATAFFRDGWQPTYRELLCDLATGCPDPFYRRIWGWMRNLSNLGKASWGLIADNDSGGMGAYDEASTNHNYSNKDVSRPKLGGWFYRTP
jgi:hypothetical protein